ncbi:hypothetical protein AYO40_04650 [Planctomycetaceae bacterium SCGC AG-212-D15]|nr:hypothetical protein AYO40_04650 [Planctomycetaceae bacterium SCGC AG-212-D15]
MSFGAIFSGVFIMMLRWPLLFLMLALGAGFFGFGGASWGWARIVCYILIGMAALSCGASYLTMRHSRR